MRIRTRLLASLLVAVLVAALTPPIAWAAGDPGKDGGAAGLRPAALDSALPDGYETGAGDDTMATARDITASIPRWDAEFPGWGKAPYTEFHTIDTANVTQWDEDWVKFTVSSDDYTSWTQLSYLIEAYTSNPDVDLVVDVFGPGHLTPTPANTFPGPDSAAIESNDDSMWTYRPATYGHWSSVSLVPRDDPGSSGTFYVRVRPFHSTSASVGFSGRAGGYSLRIKFGQVTRLSGADRIKTAIAISKEGWPTMPAESVDTTVVLASGWGYADALAASSLAGACGMPVLLTRADHLTTEVKNEIIRLGAKGCYVIGGPSTIQNGVIEDLQVFLDSSRIKRVWGTDRILTSVAVLNETKAVLATTGQSVPRFAFVAYAYNYPDALAVSPIAYRARVPVLLTRHDRLPAPVATAIQGGIDDLIVLGGRETIWDDVMADINVEGGLAANRFTRIAGADRYETAKEIASWASDLTGPGTRLNGWVGTEGNPIAIPSLPNPYLNAYASGQNYPDALAGGAFAGRAGAPMLLTRTAYAPAILFGADGEMEPGQTQWYSDLAVNNRLPILRSYVLGGDSAVSEDAFIEIDNNTGDPGGP